jgi:osmoprotectant transport system permease protein
MLGGSLLIAALAITVDLVLALIQRLFLSRGASSQPNRSQQAAVDLTDPVLAGTVVQGGTS